MLGCLTTWLIGCPPHSFAMFWGGISCPKVGDHQVQTFPSDVSPGVAYHVAPSQSHLEVVWGTQLCQDEQNWNVLIKSWFLWKSGCSRIWSPKSPSGVNFATGGTLRELVIPQLRWESGDGLGCSLGCQWHFQIMLQKNQISLGMIFPMTCPWV